MPVNVNQYWAAKGLSNNSSFITTSMRKMYFPFLTTDMLVLFFSSSSCLQFTLREIPLHTLFFKTVYFRLQIVKADIRTPHLPVSIARLLQITESCKWVFRILLFM